MSKAEWLKHRAEVLDLAGHYAIGDENSIMSVHSKGCRSCRERLKTIRANYRRRERDGALRSLGLVKTPYGWE